MSNILKTVIFYQAECLVVSELSAKADCSTDWTPLVRTAPVWTVPEGTHGFHVVHCVNLQ